MGDDERARRFADEMMRRLGRGPLSDVEVESEMKREVTAGRHGDAEARGLLAALGMTYHEASVGIGEGEWFVYLHIPCRFPDLSAWEGWPVRYRRMGEVRAL